LTIPVVRSAIALQEEDVKALHYYGVGSCGPRGFYGTIDAHVRLEEALAQFMGTAEAIVYSYDIATVPSVLPAFTTKKDIVVLDECASWPLRNGAALSRARGARTVLFILTSNNALNQRYVT
jgi:serine palmitoyltransferase